MSKGSSRSHFIAGVVIGSLLVGAAVVYLARSSKSTSKSGPKKAPRKRQSTKAAA